MSDIATVAAIVLCLLIAGNALGWLTVQDIPNRPWSWRVFLGPIIYGRWNDRRPR